MKILSCLLLACFFLTTSAPTNAGEPVKATDTVQRWTHTSGATIYLVERHDLPFVDFEITTRTGALWDPIGKEGLAAMTADLLTRGTKTRDRKTLEATLDVLGADLEVDNDHDSLTLSGDGLARNLDAAMELVADMITQPAFAEPEFAKLRRERESELLRVRDHDRALARRFYDRSLLGTHPYGRPSDGTLAGLKAIAPEDVETFYKEHFVASNLIFGFAGDLTRAQAEALLDKHFGKMRTGAAPKLTLPDQPGVKGRQVLLVNKPDRSQNQIYMGHRGPLAPHKDQDALDVVNTLFGGTFTARLNHEIRDQRGLSYGAYSYVESDRYAGTFTLWTFPSSSDAMKTVGLLISLFEDLRRKPLTAQEVDFAKQYLINSFAFRIDTPSKLLDEVIRADLHGRPADDLSTYVDRIEALTLPQIQAALERHLDPDNFLLVMLCTATGFEEPARAIPGVETVRVVPFDAPF